MQLTAIPSKNKISNLVSTKVSVLSDTPLIAYECRGFLQGETPSRGTGRNLLSGEGNLTSDGLRFLGTPIQSFEFEVEGEELLTEGNYTVCIFAMDIYGVWSDGSILIFKPSPEFSVSDTKVTLFWEAVPEATSYSVYEVKGDTEVSLSENITSTSFVVEGLQNGQNYIFVVKAYIFDTLSYTTEEDYIYAVPRVMITSSSGEEIFLADGQPLICAGTDYKLTSTEEELAEFIQTIIYEQEVPK